MGSRCSSQSVPVLELFVTGDTGKCACDARRTRIWCLERTKFCRAMLAKKIEEVGGACIVEMQSAMSSDVTGKVAMFRKGLVRFHEI